MKKYKLLCLSVGILLVIGSGIWAYRTYVHSHTAALVTETLKGHLLNENYQPSDSFPFDDMSPLWWVYSGHLAVWIAPFSSFEFVIPNPENIPEPDGLGNLQVLTTSPESLKAIMDVTAYFRRNGFLFEKSQSNTLETKIAPNAIYSAAWYAPITGVRCRFDIREPVHGIMGETPIPNFTGIVVCGDSSAYKSSYKEQAPFIDAVADRVPYDFPDGRKYFSVLYPASPSPYCGDGQKMKMVAVMDVFTQNSTGGGVVEKKGDSWVPAFGDICANQSSSEYVQIATPVTEKIIEEEISQIGGVADHEINEIKFVADNAGLVSDSDGRPVEFFKNIFPKDIEKSFIVSIDYSIKLNNNVSQQIQTTWLAGNGEEGADGWIHNKLVYIRIDKTSGGYAGTILGTGL
ncbi:MAG: hypothetical protein WCG55_04605 [bacterium]